MRNSTMAVLIAASMLAGGLPVLAQQGEGDAVVTVLPKQEGGAVPPSVANQDLSIKVNGKNAKVTKWEPFKDGNNQIELVMLIDDSARTSLGGQMDYLAHFINTLPPSAKAAVAYMQNGVAVFAGPLTADHAQLAKELHIPGGSPGSNASPYFCLSDLAKRWPSNDTNARREVVMVTDGVDNYNRRFDPEDPYVQAAITDAVRAHLVVYALYWRNQGIADQTAYANNTGQNLLLEVTDATGGKSFWEGFGNPVSLAPFLDELSRRLRNQYELSFIAPVGNKAEVETLKLKLSAPGTDVAAPQEVVVQPTGDDPPVRK